RVPADHDRPGPAWHETGDALDYDRLAEHDAAEDVADRAVRRAPHLLQAELGDPGLVRSDRRAFGANGQALDGVGRVDGDLVVGGVAILYRKVVIMQIDIEVWQD